MADVRRRIYVIETLNSAYNTCPNADSPPPNSFSSVLSPLCCCCCIKRPLALSYDRDVWILRISVR